MNDMTDAIPTRAEVEARIEAIRALGQTMTKTLVAFQMQWRCATFINLTNTKWFGALGVTFLRENPRPYRGPDNVSKAQLERVAQAKRDAELAASARRAALLATKGEVEDLRALRQRPDFMLTNDGRHVVTIAALKTEYNAEIQKGKK